MTLTMPIRVVAMLAAAVIAAVLAAAAAFPAASEARCKGANSTRQSFASAERAIRCLINRERRKRGLRALRNDRRLARIAQVHARDMIRYRFLGHNSPRHGSLQRRVRRSGYGRGRSYSFGEILGAGRKRHGTPRHIVAVWMTRPIHSRAILFPRFRSMGVGGVVGMPSRGRAARDGRNFVVTFGG